MHRQAHMEVCLSTKSEEYPNTDRAYPACGTATSAMPSRQGRNYVRWCYRKFAGAQQCNPSGNPVMQGERTTAPGSPREAFEKGRSCLPKANFDTPCLQDFVGSCNGALRNAITVTSSSTTSWASDISPSPSPHPSGSTSCLLYERVL